VYARVRLQALTGEEQIVYQAIHDAGNEGIWTKILKSKTNLHQMVITSCLKSLEKKSLVKSIKSIKNPTRKLYMLIDMVPSNEVTGGPWFTDQELDLDFIQTLGEHCYNYIHAASFPSSARDALYASTYTGYPSASDVRRYIMNKRIVTIDLTQEDVEMLLDVLVYDGKVIKMHQHAFDEDEDEVRNNGMVYKAVRERGIHNALTNVPCGKCALSSFCSQDGPVNPTTCVYFAQWNAE
jgi:DNA-directed RNA polymerase III subunit RPC6